MNNKLLILYKTEKQNNNEFGKIYDLTNLYANNYTHNFNNIDSYFIVSDNTLGLFTSKYQSLKSSP